MDRKENHKFYFLLFHLNRKKISFMMKIIFFTNKIKLLKILHSKIASIAFCNYSSNSGLSC